MRGTAQHEPPNPLPAIERGWQEYVENVLHPDVDEYALTMAKLGYYAGAAHAVSLLLSDQPETWPETVDAVATEVLDETDRLLLEAVSRPEDRP